MSKTKMCSKKKSEVVRESVDKPKKKSDEDDPFVRVEQHIIKPSNPAYEMLAEFCHLSKNLYNQGNYLLRQQFFAYEKQSSYEQLDKILKAKTDFPDYRNMPTAQSAQQDLRLLVKDWKSFWKAIRDWKKHPEKYKGRPKPPHFLRKDGQHVLTLTNQECKIRDGKIVFPKAFNGFTVEPQFVRENKNSPREIKSFQQVRFVPHGGFITLEIVYRIKEVPQRKPNGRYAGIDLGVNNFVTMAFSTGDAPIIVNGRIPKSINQFYNKRLASLQEMSEHLNGRKMTRRIQRLIDKRNAKLKDYLHKTSRLIVDHLVALNIPTLIIGLNRDWKERSPFTAKENQHFVGLPFARLIEMIEYKAYEHGIAVVVTEESYTSGTSFLDGEPPTREFYNKKRRIHRGLFRSNDGTRVNADVNGALQIVKKVVPNAFADGIEGVVLRPIMVAPTRIACAGLAARPTDSPRRESA